jgi:hypothetical protein
MLREIGRHRILYPSADFLYHIRLGRVRTQFVFLQELVILDETRGNHVRIRYERELAPSGERHEAAKLEQKRRNQNEKQADPGLFHGSHPFFCD